MKRKVIILVFIITFWGILIIIPSKGSIVDLLNLIELSPNYEFTYSNINDYIYNYEDQDFGVSSKYLSYINRKDEDSTIPTFITKSEAKDDVEFLFQMFKYSYAGYLFFGGDEKFNESKSKILDFIDSYNGDISTNLFGKIILEQVGFIQDAHFKIAGKSPIVRYKYYSNEELMFTKSNKGFYTNINGKKLKVKYINGEENISQYMKLSINNNGELCYYIGIVERDKTSIRMELVLENNKGEISKDIILYQKEKYKSPNSFSYSKRGDIPVITMPRMYEVDENDNSVKEFIESANLVNNEPYIILDIRGNYGGNDVAALSWFKNYIGEVPKISYKELKLYSLVNNIITMEYAKEIEPSELDLELQKEFIAEIERANVSDNRWYIQESEAQNYSNENIVFVLIDNKVASSGESFIHYLKTLDNVILVGENTSGTYLSNVFTESKLPNSNLNLTLGNTLTLIENFEEGRGVYPDLWVNGDDVIDRIVEYINRIK